MWGCSPGSLQLWSGGPAVLASPGAPETFLKGNGRDWLFGERGSSPALGDGLGFSLLLRRARRAWTQLDPETSGSAKLSTGIPSAWARRSLGPGQTGGCLWPRPLPAPAAACPLVVCVWLHGFLCGGGAAAGLQVLPIRRLLQFSEPLCSNGIALLTLPGRTHVREAPCVCRTAGTRWARRQGRWSGPR